MNVMLGDIVVSNTEMRRNEPVTIRKFKIIAQEREFKPEGPWEAEILGSTDWRDETILREEDIITNESSIQRLADIELLRDL